LPDYEEQVRIGDLLYKMEMKIRTNNKINDNLPYQSLMVA
jgi:type I restriction enzyme S subunit